jgi:thyroid receptor-interacting protein 11
LIKFQFLIRKLLTEKERDIELRTQTIQKELNDEKAKQSKFNTEIQQLQQQLQEAKNGLMAAARLSDQLELNQHTIERLNNESKF